MKSVILKSDLIVWLLTLSIFLMGCEETIEIEATSEITDGIVFSGVITDKRPPYFFLLVKPAPLQAENHDYEGISEAQVVITDVTANIVDTLQFIPAIWDDDYYFHYNYYDYVDQKMDKTPISSDKMLETGLYVTTKIYGIEGHTYTLDIEYKGKHHLAQETMVPHTPILDIKIKTVDLGAGKTKMAVPYISFINRPEEENYYLISMSEFQSRFDVQSQILALCGGHSYWKYSILSDEHLGEYVTDFLVGDGEDTNDVYGGYYPHFPGDSIYVNMQSISKACYQGYEDMIRQLRYDGGAYTPRPANIRSNISNGAFGMFRVSAIYEKSKYLGGYR